jgi:predicted dehydrogenase
MEVRMPLGYGLLGAGAFGSFCLQQYQTLPTIKPVAVADTNAAAADALAKQFGLTAYHDFAAMLADPAVHIVHLATPPFTHADLVKQAVAAGKHVLCEKPLAIDADDGRAMIAAAEAADRVLAVNLIMRYDPLNRAVDAIVKEKLLGDVIAGNLLNLARDNQLSPTHWFWDKSKSGGIFVEHAVHFFDLFELWLGPGEVQSAVASTRPGNDAVEEQVRCVTRHPSGVLVEQYHGFHQPQLLDRQELRLICERGDILLRGWLSETIEIDALLDRPRVERLQSLLADYSLSVSSSSIPEPTITARHRTWPAEGRYKFSGRLPMDKPTLYGQVIRDLMADQVTYAEDRKHVRAITEANGLRSLEIAAAARRAAEHKKN